MAGLSVPLERASSPADDDLVTEHVEKRWTRYGHDRLYVQTSDGTRLGYWNVKTGQTFVDGGTRADETSGAGCRSGAR